jgi:hypothetical protein
LNKELKINSAAQFIVTELFYLQVVTSNSRALTLYSPIEISQNKSSKSKCERKYFLEPHRTGNSHLLEKNIKKKRGEASLSIYFEPV